MDYTNKTVMSKGPRNPQMNNFQAHDSFMAIEKQIKRKKNLTKLVYAYCGTLKKTFSLQFYKI